MIQSTLRARFAAVVCISLLLVATVTAEIPQYISYQGKITDAGGTPVGDDTYTMRFRICDAASGGSALWDSGELSVAITQGIASVLLGESPQPALDLPFDADYWLQVSFQGADQTPRVRMTSVGYSYMASGLVPGTEVVGSLPEAGALRGTNMSTTGTAPGLRGQSSSAEGRGVEGVATASGGFTYGVYGLSSSTAGTGVFGKSQNGTNGVYGVSNATYGRGVVGLAGATTGETYGVNGCSQSTGGTGVYGLAAASTGITYGVYGRSDSDRGTGVFGLVTATSGVSFAVYGLAQSPAGYAGYFAGNARVTGNLTVDGTLSGSGIGDITSVIAGTGLVGGAQEGDATLSVEVPLRLDGSDTEPTLGCFNHLTSGSATGVYGHSFSTDGRGVEGYASASTGNAYGVYGATNSSYGTGVYGYALSTAPDAEAEGVSGWSRSENGCGVHGVAATSSGQAHGGRFESYSSEGTGVRGYALSTAPDAIANGVVGITYAMIGCGVVGNAAATSGQGIGGWFTSSSSEGTGVYGAVISSTNADRYGVDGYCFPNENWGIGVRGEGGYRGVHGISAHTSGAYATYGVYGEASGAAVNWGVYASGNMGCSGTKSAVVRTADGPKAVYCMESTEVWFEDFGTGEIQGGQAVVSLAGDFLQTVTVSDASPIKVFVTPGSDLGRWWVQKGTSDFRLIAPDAPDGATFDYRVVAKRAGYEGVRLESMPDAYSDHFLYPHISEVPAAHQAGWLKSDAVRKEQAPDRATER